MSVRYLLCPGWVRSRVDGDRHYVTASQLAALYGVPLSACLVLPEIGPERAVVLFRATGQKLIELKPRSDGRYSLPLGPIDSAIAEAVAAEREACAQLCEGMHEEDRPGDYAYAIRARGAA